MRVEAWIWAVETCCTSGAVVSETIEPTRLPAEMGNVGTSGIVAEVRADPGCSLVIPILRIGAALLCDFAERFWKGGRVAVGNSYAGSHHGNGVWGEAFGACGTMLRDEGVESCVADGPCVLCEVRNVVAAVSLDSDVRDLRLQMFEDGCHGGNADELIDPLEL